jgi:hypothetical protein
MPNQNTNTTDATRGSSLLERVTARKQELEQAFATLAPDDRARSEIESALNEVTGLLTGDLDHIPRVVSAELNNWLESNKHVNERIPTAPIGTRTARHLRSYDDLVAFLVANEITHAADPASFTVEIASRVPAVPSGLLVRWEQKIPYIQVIKEIVGPVPQDRVREVETALSHVNDVAMIPGYGYSYQARAIYYRLSVPIYDGDISTDAIDRAITVVLNNSLQLEPALRKVVEGASGANVLDDLAAHN